MLLPDYPLRLRFSFVFCVANATHACPDCCMMCGDSEAVAITASIVIPALSLSWFARRSLSCLHSSASRTVCPKKAVSHAPESFSSAFSSSGVAHWYNLFRVPFKTG